MLINTHLVMEKETFPPKCRTQVLKLKAENRFLISQTSQMWKAIWWQEVMESIIKPSAPGIDWKTQIMIQSTRRNTNRACVVLEENGKMLFYRRLVRDGIRLINMTRDGINKTLLLLGSISLQPASFCSVHICCSPFYYLSDSSPKHQSFIIYSATFCGNLQ